MARHPHAERMSSKPLSKLFLLIGPIVVRIFGWPLHIGARALSRCVLSSFGLLTTEGQRILDAGGAYGCYSFELAKRGCNVTIIDTDNESLELGKTIKDCLKANVTFAKMDITSTGFRDATFDGVLMSHVLEHIKDDQQAMEEIRRVLKPGGVLLLAFPYSHGPIEYSEPMVVQNGKVMPASIVESHWRSGYNEKTIANLLHNCGFSIESADYYAPPAFLPRSSLLFPILYPVSSLLLLLGGSRSALLVKAKSKY